MIGMKKLSIFTFIVSALLGINCYATGNESGPISQMELADYVIIAGAIIFLIGLALILLSLFMNTSSKKVADEEYDEYFDNTDIQDDEEPVQAEESTEDTEDEENAEEEPVEEIHAEDNITEEVQEEIADEEIIEEAPDEDITEEPTAETVEEETIEEEPEVVPEPVEEVKSIRLTLSGINNPDLKMVSITDSVTAGRRSTNGLLISDSAVSGEHCKFTYDGETLFVEDLNSTNGTFLNGEQIEKSEIKSGDKIILGQKQYRITLS